MDDWARARECFGRQAGWRIIDLLFLSFFTVLITLHPYYLQGEINFFELGLYLPGISSILSGGIPYRDFFYLRGPLELYIPAFFMGPFGKNVAVLSTFFYVGTLLTLLLCILIAGQLYRTRWMLYLMVPVLVARTFPRVVFTYWGGMRYALGLLVVFLAIKFLKNQKKGWLYAAGVVSALALLTSIEVGVCAIATILGTLVFYGIFRLFEKDWAIRMILVYSLGILSVGIPYAIYLYINHALAASIDSVFTVMTRMPRTIDMHLISIMPKNPWEALLAMVNPNAENFKHMTPAYLYLILVVCLFRRIKRGELNTDRLCIVCLGLYGLLLYIAAFRMLWSSQLEMALQPEKILLFFLLEELYLKAKGSPCTRTVQGEPFFQRVFLRYLTWSRVLVGILILSSLGYAIQRFNHRFFAFKLARNYLLGKDTKSLNPLAGQKTKPLLLPTMKGLTVPLLQAQELEEIFEFVQTHTKPREKVFMFPELGAYSFIVDRPFVGRFPMVPFSWFKEEWHKEFVSDLREQRPRYVIVSKALPDRFASVYFKRRENKEYYDAIKNFVHNYYQIIEETPLSYIYYRLKEER